jgi:aspartate kinase
MPIVVQKYGGSSVKNAERFKRVAQRIAWKQAQGFDVVVVVSAPGDTTDDLLERAAELTKTPADREIDMLLSTGEQVSVALLAMALHAHGVKAVSLTGPQAGFRTDDTHRAGRIQHIETARVKEELAQGKVVIVAGFQGEAPNGDITTLGRGGSDASAIALAAYLQADECQIYTDVDGIYSADPRIIPGAQRLDEIAYDEILELAAAGAQVMQLRSVELAKQYGVGFKVMSSYAPLPHEGGDEEGFIEVGTRVVAELSPTISRVVSGVAVDRNVAHIALHNIPDQPGIAARVFGALGVARVNLDMIVQSVGRNRQSVSVADISFTCTRSDVDRAASICHEILVHWPGAEVRTAVDVAKVSIVGSGVQSNWGVAGLMFEALAENGINIELITGSEIKISCLVKEEQVVKAAQVVHTKFGLNKALQPVVE